MDSCIAAHPGWEVTLWTSVDQFGLLQNKRAFFGADALAPLPPKGNPGQVRSNVLRFEIMLRYGGVFLDTDIWCHQSLEPLVAQAESEGKAGILGWEVQDRWLGEAVIAAHPKAGFMQRIVDGLEPWAFRRARRAATVTVGPQYITPRLLGSPELHDVMVVPEHTFYPAAYNQPERSSGLVSGEIPLPEGTVATHMFGNFRRRNGLVWA